VARDAEIVVVGAGVMGLATARALARAGRDVLLYEQFGVGHDRGSSHGSSRIVRLSYPEERWVRLAQESYPLWRELEAEAGLTLLELNGTLDLGDWEPNRAALAACGVASEVLDAAEIGRRFGIRVEPGERGLYQEDGGIVLADLALETLRDSALAAGAQLHEHTKVDSLDAVGARMVVVTAGAWAPEIAGVDARPTRETVSYFELAEPTPSVIDTTAGPSHGYALAAPGVGPNGMALKAGLHHSGPVVDPDEPGAPDTAIADRAADWVATRFPGAGARIALDTCVYTTRAGNEFLLERRGNVVVGSPCSGHGFKFAPAIGRRLAALALEGL
jgi:sarcosine oxidase